MAVLASSKGPPAGHLQDPEQHSEDPDFTRAFSLRSGRLKDVAAIGYLRCGWFSATTAVQHQECNLGDADTQGWTMIEPRWWCQPLKKHCQYLHFQRCPLAFNELPFIAEFGHPLELTVLALAIIVEQPLVLRRWQGHCKLCIHQESHATATSLVMTRTTRAGEIRICPDRRHDDPMTGTFRGKQHRKTGN